jgi:hypothetical protein
LQYDYARLVVLMFLSTMFTRELAHGHHLLVRRRDIYVFLEILRSNRSTLFIAKVLQEIAGDPYMVAPALRAACDVDDLVSRRAAAT